MDEADLIRQAANGDQVAYEQLMRSHQQAVFRLAYLLSGDAGDAEDIAQETFIRVFKALHRVDPSHPFRPYVLRVTTNLAYNHRRSISRYVKALQRFAQGLPADNANRHDSTADDARSIVEAVRRLSRSDQEIIYLRYFLDLSAADTAETLGIAEGTVKSRLHRALDRLRKVFTSDGSEPGVAQEEGQP